MHAPTHRIAAVVRSARRPRCLVAGRWALCAAVLLAGCNGRSKPQQPAEPVAGKRPAEESLQRCDEMLGNALTMLHPEQVELTADRNDAVSLLNTWLRCGVSDSEATPALAPEARSTLEPLLSPDQLARVVGENFSVRDGSHITAAILMDRIAEFAAGPAQNQLDRAVALFYYVARNVALVGPPASDAPLRPFEILLVGRGDAQDRAWIFAELLRQLQIDSVVLLPASDDDPAAERPLVGVLLENQVYLFDPELGLPIPAASERSTPVPRRPATLAEVLATPDLLRRVVAERGQTYPWTAASFERPRVHMVANTSLWSPPMKRLQASLTGARSAVVHEDIEDTGTGPGLLSRIAAGGEGHWSRDDIRVWDYPEQQMEGAEAPNSELQRLRDLLMAPLEVPIPFSLTKDAGLTIERAERAHWQARVKQLMGDYPQAGTSFLAIRLQATFPQQLLAVLPQDFVQIHLRAVEEALYWGGIVKFEQGEYTVAADIFGDYLRRYPPQFGSWREPAQYLLALSLLETGNRIGAAQALANAQSERSRLLLESLK